jgi:hypothetical protein
MTQLETDRLKDLAKQAYKYYGAINWTPDWGDIIDYVAERKAELEKVDRATVDLDELNTQLQEALGCQDEDDEEEDE